MRASSRGQGSIFQRKRSRFWWCRYRLRGREIRESTGIATDDKNSEKRAFAFLRKRMLEVGADKIGARPFVGPQSERVTVDQLLNLLEPDYELRKKGTGPTFHAHLKHIRAYFGACRALDVTTEVVDRYILEQRHQGYKDATINRGTQLLSQAFRLGIDGKLLSTAPRMHRLSEKDNVRKGWFADLEFQRVVDNLPEYLKDFVRFAYRSGWRKSEIASLQWEDVDLEEIRLRPEHSKNREGRTVPLVPELAELIERRRLARKFEGENGEVVLSEFVFHNQGRPIADIRKSWRTATKLAGVPGKLFHDLRRCAVRNLIRAGVPADIARTISGHKTSSVFSRYCIVDQEMKREALERTRAYLAGRAERERERLAVISSSVQ